MSISKRFGWRSKAGALALALAVMCWFIFPVPSLTLGGYSFRDSTTSNVTKSNPTGDAGSLPSIDKSRITLTEAPTLNPNASQFSTPKTASEARVELESKFRTGLASERPVDQLNALRGIWSVCFGFSSGGEIGKQSFGDSNQGALLMHGYPERIAAARDLFALINAQCLPITNTFTQQEAMARSKSLVASGFSPAQSGKIKKILAQSERTPEDAEFLDSALSHTEARAEILAWGHQVFADVLARTAAQKLSDAEREAAVWLATCKLGADCSASGTVLIRACVNSYLCFSSSLEDGLASAYSIDQLKQISNAASALLEMMAKGSAGFPIKK